MSNGRVDALPAVLLVMGVSGAGKSTHAAALAEEFGWPFKDADEFHPQANIDKMAAGAPLDDTDRWPWLDRIAVWIDAHRSEGTHGIVTCSALKRIYRDRLLAGRPDVRLVYLKGEHDLIERRMNARADHFMPPKLLASQFATLEEPVPSEWAIVVPIDRSPRYIKEQILAELAQ
ncbi:MAG: gluconokinase [Pseudomonadota bacterium]